MIVLKNITLTPTLLESRISEVIVYLSGAQVIRTASFRITEPVQSFVFTGLPGGLQAESIRISVDNDKGAVIRSVEHAVNHLQTEEQNEEIQALRHKLKDLEKQLLQEKNTIELGTLEEKLFAKNVNFAGQESGLKAEELKATVLFYNERMSAIRDRRLACNERIDEINNDMTSVRGQLGSFNRNPHPISEIVVTVADAELTPDKMFTLTLSYFVYGAGWQPSYDIRVKDVSGDVALHYKGKVSQCSGENWEDVKLSLSTGNPSVSGTCPQLHPWYLDLPEGRLQKLKMSEPRRRAGRQEEYAIPYAIPIEGPPTTASAAPPEQGLARERKPEPAVSVTESINSMEYNITAPYTMASGDEGQDVEIAVHFLSAKYRYYSIRKLERDVFLLAAVSGWEHLNLIAGEASVFFENRYVGKTYIDPLRADETIDLSLGTDKSVLVSRVRGKDFTAKTLAGGNVKQTRQWEITVRNLKTLPIEIEVKDQIPVSINKQIVVNAAEVSGADLIRDTGILTWKFTLNPAEAKSVTVKYVVTSPEYMPVILE
jgi:uncharacterized protein (TIGR02231 family)